MHSLLLPIHSVFRWLVLLTLAAALYKAFSGWLANKKFSPADDLLRHWTATIAHVQLMIGILLYTQSPAVKFFWQNSGANIHDRDLFFFGLIHLAGMLMAVVIITIGSAKAKRRATDKEKFSTMLIWFGVALVIILMVIPWPFSPLASRPYIRF